MSCDLEERPTRDDTRLDGLELLLVGADPPVLVVEHHRRPHEPTAGLGRTYEWTSKFHIARDSHYDKLRLVSVDLSSTESYELTFRPIHMVDGDTLETSWSFSDFVKVNT